jgi:hypothetical protein
MDRFEQLFIVATFCMQIIHLGYFALRKWEFDLGMCWGWIVYALAIPALTLSIIQLVAGKHWHLWGRDSFTQPGLPSDS